MALLFGLRQALNAPDGARLSIVLTPFFLRNWIPNNTHVFDWAGVTWSLGVEMCCYALFPLISKAVRFKWSPPVLLLATIVPATVITHWYPAQSMDLYINPLARLPEFVCGTFAATLFRARRFEQWRVAFHALPLVLLATVRLFCWLDLSPVYVAQPLASLYACWILGLAYGYTWVLALKPLVLLGKISYSFYLFHQQVCRMSSSTIW